MSADTIVPFTILAEVTELSAIAEAVPVKLPVTSPVTLPVTSVSYTHLALPTIYSV